jgi:ankyrin repeat protein
MSEPTPPLEQLVGALRRGDVAAVRALATAAPALAAARVDGVGVPLLAAYHGQLPLAAELVALRGGTADLHEAAALGLTRALCAHLEAGRAGLDAPAPDGHRALGLAAFFGQEEAVALLLEAGADPRLASENAMRVTPLHAAVSRGSAAIVTRLLAAGAAVDARQQGGFTALHAAAKAGREDLVRALLAAGADRQARTGDGRSPADLARLGGHVALASLLDGTGGGA